MGNEISNSNSTSPFSIELSGTENSNKGYGNIRKSKYDVNIQKHALTLYDNFQHGVQSAPDRPCLGKREILSNGTAGQFQWMTYRQANEHITYLGSGLSYEFNMQSGEFVGVFSKNVPEWVLVEQACNRQGMVLVPLYDTLGEDVVPYIVNHVQMRVLFCGKQQTPVVLKCLAECPSLKYIIQFEENIVPSLKDEALDLGVQLMPLSFLEKVGKQNIVPPSPSSPDDLATICYTSGTTGNPKGAMLTHRNIMLSAISLGSLIQLTKDDVHLSYLPLPHMFERLVQVICFYNSTSIGFYQGDVVFLMDDLATLAPTVFPSVPRLFNRVYDKINQGVAASGGIKKLLFDYAYQSKKSYLDGGHVTHGLWDRLVFSKLRMILGGRVRLIISGSAPLSPAVKDFLQIAFCCNVLEGYGLTETCASGSITSREMPSGPHVGAPVPLIEICLADVPEMNYTSRDTPRPRGEILLRGPSIFQGYYKAPELTRDCMDDDGWFHTGDIGCWNPNGTLAIIDRKKNIFKLSQGEYIAPEKIENVYIKSTFVAQCFIFGNSLKSCLVAIVVPDPETICTWAKQQQLPNASNIESLAALDIVKELIFQSMTQVATDAKLKGFECAKAIHLDPTPFSVENGLITPTFKLKRNALKEHYATAIEAIKLDLLAKVALVYTCIKLCRQLYYWHQPQHSCLRKGTLKKCPKQHELFQDDYFLNRQGLWLFTREWINITKPIKGIVFLVHGLGEHIGRYNYLAQQLTQQGYFVFGLDHQGHGQSEGDRLAVEKFDHFGQDYLDYIESILSRTISTISLRQLPRFILGHSMGGAITLTILEHSMERSIQWTGVVLSAPALKPDPKIATPMMLAISKLLSMILPKMPVNSVDGSTISRNELVVAHYMRDPLVPKSGVTARLATELIGTMNRLLKKASTFDVPMLLLQGSDDKLVVPEGAVEFYDNYKGKDIQLKVYPALFHEILNSDEKKEIISDVIEWINEHYQQ